MTDMAYVVVITDVWTEEGGEVEVDLFPSTANETADRFARQQCSRNDTERVVVSPNVRVHEEEK